MVRLQKFLSECGVASRRGAEKLIVEGLVTVNGHRVTELGTKVDPENDHVEIKGKPVRPAEKGILLLNKPKNVITTLHDPEGRRTIADYMTKKDASYFPVGRLDRDSTGLVILTNDGELADRLMHPRYECRRVYELEVEGRVPDKILEKLEQGVSIEGVKVRLKVDSFKALPDSSALKVSIFEGRNRIIRRLMERVGYPVKKLKRIAHGPINLGTIKRGEVERLSRKEYLKIRAEVFKDN